MSEYTLFAGVITNLELLQQFLAPVFGYRYHIKRGTKMDIVILTPKNVDSMCYSGGRLLLPVYTQEELPHLIANFEHSCVYY